ncbi:MAG: biotin--[acetyl-CoA-carboxylase] ligase [Actinobacteria bacterium]|nr:biotin--[acetyl-CoA-carboxylase] ligase [Actinomycetota bacterium]
MPPGSPTWGLDLDRLGKTRFTTVRIHEELPSTNTALVEEARAGAPEGLVLVADHQTAGRGRLGRTWSAEPGTALLVSVLLRPPLPVDEVPLVLMAAGLAACDGVEAAAGFRPQLKWPNDLVVDDRKLAGLLTEATGGSAPGVVLGLGINVSTRAYPPELSREATSCEEIASKPIDRTEVLIAFLAALESRYSTALAPGGRETTLTAYRSDSATLGRRVRVELTSGPPLEGHANRLADDGQLVVTDDAGTEHLVNVGDVKHLRS